MSQHSFKTPKFTVQMGVDRPLSNVFASIFVNDVPEDAEDDSAPGFNPFLHLSWFAASKVGVQTAVHYVEKYIQENGEPNVKVPLTLVADLERDVRIHLADPSLSLNWGNYHGFVE